HRLVGAAGLGGHLGLEAGGLILGIVQLAEGVEQLAAVDEELEAIDEVRIGVLLAGERRDLERVVDDEDRHRAIAMPVVGREEGLGEVFVGREEALALVVALLHALAVVRPVDRAALGLAALR